MLKPPRVCSPEAPAPGSPLLGARPALVTGNTGGLVMRGLSHLEHGVLIPASYTIDTIETIDTIDNIDTIPALARVQAALDDEFLQRSVSMIGDMTHDQGPHLLPVPGLDVHIARGRLL